MLHICFKIYQKFTQETTLLRNFILCLQSCNILKNNVAKLQHIKFIFIYLQGSYLCQKRGGRRKNIDDTTLKQILFSGLQNTQSSLIGDLLCWWFQSLSSWWRFLVSIAVLLTAFLAGWFQCWADGVDLGVLREFDVSFAITEDGVVDVGFQQRLRMLSCRTLCCVAGVSLGWLPSRCSCGGVDVTQFAWAK